MFYSTKRQQFLVDQGYAFKIITHLEGLDEVPDLVFKTRDEQIALLSSVLLANDSDGDIGTDIKGEEGDVTGIVTSSVVQRASGSLAALSGGQHMSYMEQNMTSNRRVARGGSDRPKLFARRDRDLAAARIARRDNGGT
jgi:DNA excision repair protein ERCC-3